MRGVGGIAPPNVVKFAGLNRFSLVVQYSCNPLHAVINVLKDVPMGSVGTSPPNIFKFARNLVES